MDLPATDVEVKPEKIEGVKELGPSFHCDLFDTGIVHKIAQVFLPGLASACVDNTTGGLFNSPGSVAVDVRKEMVEYLTQRSETFVAESVILEGGPDSEGSDHPYDIISDFVDDFANLKRNLFSRVSGWLLSERREDRIDDFVQELEINGFWLMERREAIAQRLLKNVDFKNTFHCDMKFNNPEELFEHSLQCGFRTMNCTNEGCTALFCVAQLEYHDSICAFKVLQCEQKCSDSIMRREMDRHCVTVCPMKLVNCPFYQVGCQSTVPRCTIEDHCLENLRSHMLHVLRVIHKEASVDDIKEWAEELKKSSSSSSRIAEARDVRSLTFAIKDLEAKMGPLKVNSKSSVSEECANSPIKRGECIQAPCTVSPTKKDEYKKSPTKREECALYACTVSPTKKEKYNESPTKEEDSNESSETPTKKEEFKESLLREEECDHSITEKVEFDESHSEKEQCTESPAKQEEFTKSLTNREEFNESSPRKEGFNKSYSIKEEFTESLSQKEQFIESPTTKE